MIRDKQNTDTTHHSSLVTHHLVPEVALVALSLALSWGFILISGFDGLYGQDPYSYFAYAGQVRESLGRGQLPPPYYWPLGYPALVALGFALIGPSPLAGQIVSTLAGAGVAALTCALARDLLLLEGLPARTSHWVGVVAGLLAIACGQLWQWSISLMADTTALFWATLAAWALVRYSGGIRGQGSGVRGQGPGTRGQGSGDHSTLHPIAYRLSPITYRLSSIPYALVLSAIALACAMMTRWVYALLVLPLGAYWLLTVWRTWRHGDMKGSGVRGQGSGVRRSYTLYPIPYTLYHALIAVLVGLVALAPQIAISAASPRLVVGHEWLVEWSPLNALRHQFVTADGTATYAQPVALFYTRAAVSPRYLFPLFTPLLFLGLWAAFRQRRWRLVTLLIVWGAVVYGFLCGVPYQNFRFTLTFLPPVAILTAFGLCQAWKLVLTRWRGLLLIYVLVGFIGGLWYSDRVLDEFAASKRADLAVAHWVERQVRPGDQVLAFGITLTLQHYTPLDVREFFVQTPKDLGALLADRRPTYLLLIVDDLNQQWRGYPPEQNYHWLRDGPGLSEVGKMNGYTLYRIRDA